MRVSLEVQIMMRSILFSGFSQNDCYRLHTLLKPSLKTFESDTVILNENESIKWIGIIHTGKLMGMKFYYEGTANLFHNYLSGDVINVAAAASAFKTSPLTLVSDRDTKILIIPAEYIFNDRINDQYRERLKDNMLHILADENIRFLYKTEVLSKKLLRDRIWTYLLIMREKRGRDSFHIMMNREQFAQYLCVNRSALSHELSKMRKEGLISFEKDFFEIHRVR